MGLIFAYDQPIILHFYFLLQLSVSPLKEIILKTKEEKKLKNVVDTYKIDIDIHSVWHNFPFLLVFHSNYKIKCVILP